MMTLRTRDLVALTLVCAATLVASISRAADPLPSWNGGAAKRSILEFVGEVARSGSPDFVPGPERIAVFDNDGTPWSEQPLPV